MIKVTLPDGRVVNFPPGMSQAEISKVIQRDQMGAEYASRAAGMSDDEKQAVRIRDKGPFGDYLRDEVKKPRPGESEQDTFKRLYGSMPDNTDVGMGEGLARAAFQGATFMGGDEVTAALAAGVDTLKDDAPFGDAYDIRLSRERAKLKKFEDENPGLSLTANIAGAIPTAIAAGPQKVAETTLGKLAQGLTVGGSQGAVAGFNAGEDDRLDTAKTGALLGGGIGVAAVPVAGGAGRLAKRLMTGSAAKEAGMSRPAYQILQDAAQADDSLTGAGARRLAQAGDDAMLADAGPSQRMVLDAVMQRTGPAARVARDAIDDRVTNAGGRLSAALDDTLGQPQGVKETARNIASSTRPERQALYDAAYASPINYADDAGREIESVLSRIPDRVKREAVEAANERMTAAGVKNNQILIDIAEDGSVSFREMPNVQQLDYIKRALGEKGAVTDVFGRQAPGADLYGNLARDLKNTVSKAVPDYAAAVRAGGDKIQRDQALQMGRNLLRPGTSREDVSALAADMSDEAREAAMMGLRGSVDDMLANVKRAITDGNMEAREAVKLIKDMSSRANREKVRLIVGDGADALFDEIDRAAKAFELRGSVADNSKTFARQVMNDALKGATGAGPVSALRRGDVLGSAQGVLATLLRGGQGAVKAREDKVALELSKMLTGPRGPEAEALLRTLSAVGPRAEMGTRQARNLVEQLLQRNTAVSAPLLN